MRKIYLKLMVMVFFDSSVKNETIKEAILNDSDYYFYSGDEFDIVDFELSKINKVKNRPNQSLVEFKLILSIDEGVDISEIVKNINYDLIDLNDGNIVSSEIINFEFTDSK